VIDRVDNIGVVFTAYVHQLENQAQQNDHLGKMDSEDHHCQNSWEYSYYIKNISVDLHDKKERIDKKKE